MATRIDWSIVQSNQANLSGQVFDEDGNVMDLTGLTLALVIKPSETSADGAGSTYTPTIPNPKIGKWKLTISGSNFATPVTEWYRLDAIDGGANHTTINLGTLTVTAA